MSAAIEIKQLHKTFVARDRTVIALEPSDLSIAAGEFVTLVGASGCGKSTLLRMLGGLELPSGGDMLVGGRCVDGPGVDRAMVFQHYSLYPWLNVRENIRFCRNLHIHRDNSSSSDVERASGRVDALLALMGLEAVTASFPNQLSGGMQQRVAIARALMSRPPVLLMDEPFGALDAQTREVMHDLILYVSTLERPTVVFVTHDVDEAIYLGHRVVVMAPRPGRIDRIFDVPLPRVRTQDMKLDPAFTALKREILDRIRETSGMKTDLALLEKLTRRAEASRVETS